MMNHTPATLLKKRWKVVVLVGFFVALISGVVTAFFPLEYRADAQVLIISKTRDGVDPYTVVKSAERVGENIAQVMNTSDFYGKVKDQFPQLVAWSEFDTLSERKRRKLWSRSIKPSVIFGTGVLQVSAYSTDAAEAARLAFSVVKTLESQAWEYVGGDVAIKVVNSPVVTPYPVRPNVVINILAGFVVGLLIGGVTMVRRG